MASGLSWQPYMDYAVACPKELPFKTKIIIEGRTWECLDRGGKIIFDGTYYWVDQLTKNPQYKYGTIMPALMVKP
jgi:hypothetical protein